MAYIRNVTCSICNESKFEVDFYYANSDKICQDCWTKAVKKRERQILAGLKGLTIEERLERIEKILYDLTENPKREIVY